MMDQDNYWMRHALALAARGIFSASPNPRVGCVIVQEQRLVGAGFHQQTGTPHAEVHALAMAGNQSQGATAYVSLEPCAHFGRTPPCVDALIEARVARVVVACRDPNPQVAGKGIARLEQAGITVLKGVLEAEALHLNRAFFHRMRTGLPYVTLKFASSMDGRTALGNGESQWITGEEARKDVHFHRLQADAIIAGVGSVINDNAKLTARYPTALSSNQPLRVVIDSQGRIPNDAVIFADKNPVLVATMKTVQMTYPPHVEVLTFSADNQHKVPLRKLLIELGKRQMNHVFVEAGAGLGGAFLDANLADEVLVYVAPIFLGADARPLAITTPLTQLSDKLSYVISDSRAMGDDWRFILKLRD